MAADRAETATAVIIILGSRVLETMLDNVMQQCRLIKQEQQH